MPPAASSPQKTLLEYLIVVMAFAAVNLFYHVYQRPISLNGGRGIDGVEYCKMAEDIARGDIPACGAQYAGRVGTPYLVGKLFPDDPLWGFKVVNFAANVLSVLLLVAWLRLFLTGWRLRVLLALLFLTHWTGPVRMIHFYPAWPDPWTFVWLIGGLILIQRTRWIDSAWPAVVLAVLSSVAVLFREFFILLPILACFAANPIPRRDESESLAGWLWRSARAAVPRRWWSYLPVVVALAGALLARHVLWRATTPYPSLPRVALYYLYTKSIQSWALGFFVVAGPLGVLLIAGRRIAARFLWKNQHLMVGGLVFGLLALIGGTDTERFWFWTTPLLYVLLGCVIEGSGRLLGSPALIAVLVIGQTIAHRIYWPVPDAGNPYKSIFPVLTPWGSRLPYVDLWSYFCHPFVGALILLEYLLLCGLLLLWLDARAHRLARAVDEARRLHDGPPSREATPGRSAGPSEEAGGVKGVAISARPGGT